MFDFLKSNTHDVISKGIYEDMVYDFDKMCVSPMTSSTGKSRDFEDMVYDFEKCVIFDNDVMFGKSVILTVV